LTKGIKGDKHMKLIALILALTMLLANFSSCSGKETTPEMPEGTTLEFWITQDVSDADFSDYYEIMGWIGAKQYYGSGYLPVLNEDEYEVEVVPEYYVKYKITAWPDYADGGQYITSIDFNDPKVTVYGLTVDSSYDEFERIFSEMGYELSNDSSETFERYTASKNGISFSLETVDGKQSFSIYAEVTNKTGIVF
jgi:hypothetical protein